MENNPERDDTTMVERGNTCRACEGTGMLADDEGWQYKCSICHGDGLINQDGSDSEPRILEVDETNRLLD